MFPVVGPRYCLGEDVAVFQGESGACACIIRLVSMCEISEMVRVRYRMLQIVLCMLACSRYNDNGD